MKTNRWIARVAITSANDAREVNMKSTISPEWMYFITAVIAIVLINR